MSKENLNKIPNLLTIARRQRGLSRKGVARLIGHQSTWVLARYEEGRALPPLKIALKLEIIYRRPVAFLWPELYSALRQEIRAQEEAERGGLGGEDVR